MLSLGRFRRFAREWLAAALGVFALSIAMVVYFHEVERPSPRIRLSGGNRKGLRHKIAEHLLKIAPSVKVNLQLVETQGSEEALENVNNGTLDLALVQGGLDHSDRVNVRQVASLMVEPLHVLVKAELWPKDSEARGLELLRGHTVNLSVPGSGTYILSQEILAFAGLAATTDEKPGDYIPTQLSYDALVDEVDRTKLPDAIFLVSALPSPVARHLLNRQEYRLLPLTFGEAFALDSLHTVPAPPLPHQQRTSNGVDRVHVTNTSIPAYTYSVAPPIPPQSVPTFGTRLLLVANKDVDSGSIARLLEAASTIGPAGRALDPAQLDLEPELELHNGALAYRERIKPVHFGDAIDFLEKAASLAGALLGASFFLWQWYIQRWRRKRDLGFEAYMVKVTAIEQRALEYEISPTLDLKELLQLQLDLSRLKQEALHRLALGEIQGEELFSGFITHVNFARDYLNRMIIHERDQLEKKARIQHRPAEELWTEAVGDLVDTPGLVFPRGLGRELPPRTSDQST